MRPTMLPKLRQDLLRQRAALLDMTRGADAALRFIAEDRESELEERAQEERSARLFASLDDRGRREIEEIDAALGRLADGTFGVCVDCEEPIAPARLRLLPAAERCVACAGALEREPRAGERETVRVTAPLAGDLALLSDGELETTIREQLRADRRLEADELRVVCRHGVVHLGGALPSEIERQIVLKLLTDVNGIMAIDDRIRVTEFIPARDGTVFAPAPDGDGDGAATRAEGSPEPQSTDDVVRAEEDGLDYEPPVDPREEEI